ncbi:MAG: TRAP transporter small permease subunit [Myxococcota bacterium]
MASGFKDRLKRFDKGLARGEAAFAMLVLLSLVGVAATQSLLRNIADQDVAWANDALRSLAWADPFMEKATLWLAMLGASLATHYDKHIAIDILARVAKPKARAVMRGVVSIFAGVTSFYFARVVLGALLAKAGRIPGDYAVYNAEFETIHICLGSADDLTRAGVQRPDLFCSLRGVFDGAGLTVNTPERLMDLLVPAMFVVIAARLIASGVHAFMRVPEGGIPDHELGGEGKSAAATSAVEGDDDQDAMGEPVAEPADEDGAGEGAEDSADEDAPDPPPKKKPKKRKKKKGGRR